VIRELIDGRPAARQRGGRRPHGGDFWALTSSAAGWARSPHTAAFCCVAPTIDSTSARSVPGSEASAAGGTSAATRLGASRNSRSRARQARQVIMCGRKQRQILRARLAVGQR
jgi:hypothetical protein